MAVEIRPQGWSRSRRRMPCQCWDCRRSRGETPKVKPDGMESSSSGYRRTDKPYPMASAHERIPTNSDVNGHDRKRGYRA